ncbi:MAG: TIM barrel protein [Bryobacterales bacterium]|nr:TIM barrel protein [Bryobacterales bacterium]
MNGSTIIEAARRGRAEAGARLRLSVAARNFAATPTLESLEKIAAIGFDTVDNFAWRDPDEFRIYQENLPRLGLLAGVLVVNKVPDVNALGCSLSDPADREGFLRELRSCIAAAEQVHCDRLEVLSGNLVPGLSRGEQMASAVRTLREAAPLLERHRVTAVVEMLNSTEEHPGYFLDTVRDSLALIDAVGSPRVRLLFDIYHVQLGEGNIIRKLREHIGYIGQIHFADAPGRHEPGTGEINFRNVFRAIYELGERYTGYVTAEYHPTDQSFRDLEHVKKLATFA